MTRTWSSSRFPGRVLGLMFCALGLFPVAEAQSQICTSSIFTMNGYTEVVTGPNGSGSQPAQFGSVNWLVRNYGDSTSAGGGSFAHFDLNAGVTYRFLGLPAGTPVSQTLVTKSSGYAHTLLGDPSCDGNNAMALLLLDGGPLAGGSCAGARDPIYFECFGGAFQNSKSVSFTRPVGTSFTLATWVNGNSTDYGSSGGMVSFRFAGITPGAFLVRCDGATLAQVVGVTAEAPTGLRIGKVWPNPSRGAFRASVFVPAGGSALLRLYDVSGRIVRARAVEPGESLREIPFNLGLAPGAYFLQLNQGAHSVVQQVVIGN